MAYDKDNNFSGTGRLAGDPIQKSTTTGDIYVKFSVAISRKINNKKEGQQTADFVPTISWRGIAEDIIEKGYKKGDLVEFSGKFQSGSFMGNDNKKIYTYEININEIKPIRSAGASSSEEAPPQNAQSDDGMYDDIPF